MQTRIQVYPSARIAPIEQLHAAEVPFRAYEVLIARIKAAIADEQEEQTCVIVQTPHGPEAWYQHTLTPAERQALVWHLASLRARKTIEALLPETRADLDARDFGVRAKP